MSGLEFVSTGTAGSAGSGGGLTPTAVKTANYTAVSGDLVRVDTTSGAVTVTLPAAAAGATVGVKLVTLGASNPVTIAAAGSDVFNKAGGSTTLTLSLLNQGVILVAISGVWVVQADDLALTQLDSRYRDTPGYDIVLLAGQSNMMGKDTTIGLTTTDPTDYRISAYNDTGANANTIILAADPLAHHEGALGVGPGIEFARWYLGSVPTARRVLLVPVAHGGTAFGGSGTWRWSVSLTGNLFDIMVAQAQGALAAAGANSRIVACLWQQGEADADLARSSGSYQTDLLALIDGLRNRLSLPSLPFAICGMLPEKIAATTTYATIDTAHRAIPAARAFTSFTAGATGADFGDLLHFSAVGARKNGRALATGGLPAAIANTAAPPTAIVPATAPGQVTGLVAAAGDTQVTLSWTQAAATGGALTFNKIYRGTSPGAEGLLVAITPATTYTDTGLTDGTTYYYRVSATNAGAEGALSNEASATPAAPVAVVSDNFNRADAIATFSADGLIGQSTPTGSKTWLGRAGNWSVRSNKAAFDSSGSGIAVVDAAVADCTVQADIDSGGALDDSGLVCRYVDNNNFMEVIVDTAGVYIFKTVAGSLSVVNHAGGAQSTGSRTLKVVMAGSSVKVFQNGTLVLDEVVADAALVAATKHGLRGHNATNRFDNFAITVP